MSPNDLGVLRLVDLTLSWGIVLPFLFLVDLRTRYAKGTRQQWVLNQVVVTLRPLMRPAVTISAAFSIIRDVLGHPGDPTWLRTFYVAIDLALLLWCWKVAGLHKDDDEDGPWQRLGRRLKSLTVSPHHRPATHSA